MISILRLINEKKKRLYKIKMKYPREINIMCSKFLEPIGKVY